MLCISKGSREHGTAPLLPTNVNLSCKKWICGMTPILLDCIECGMAGEVSCGLIKRHTEKG